MNIIEFLDSEGIEYKKSSHKPTYTAQGLAHVEHISGYQVAKPVIVYSDLGYAMCVIPACKHLDLDLAAEALQSLDVRLATEREMAELFPHCELGAEPPIGTIFGLKTVVDAELHREEYVLMQTGTHQDAIEVRREDWEKLCDPIVAYITAS